MNPAGLATGAAHWYWGRLRRVRPTRDGWWCLFAAVGLGAAAVNTGNNLAYLLCAMLLAVVAVSGALSDQALRRVRLEAVVPEEIYAGRPVLLAVHVTNDKRRLASYSLGVEALRGRAATRVLHLPRLGASETRPASWEHPALARGRRRLPALRLTTRFPFALFVKTGADTLETEVLVFPAVHPLPPERLRALTERGEAAAPRRGRGSDLHDLRDYRPGDDPRRIHWVVSARAGTLMVREPEAETSLDTRLVLEGSGRDAVALERGLSEAASLAVHLLRAGGRVEVVGPGVHVPSGTGIAHARRILTGLALYRPDEMAGAGSPARVPLAPGAFGEIRILLD